MKYQHLLSIVSSAVSTIVAKYCSTSVLVPKLLGFYFFFLCFYSTGTNILAFTSILLQPLYSLSGFKVGGVITTVLRQFGSIY